MNKAIQMGVVLLSLSSLSQAEVGFNQNSVKGQLTFGLNDNQPNVGTDAGTTSFPNAGLNTVPTKDIGTDTDSNQTEMEKNYRGPAPAYPTAPAYAPPAPAFNPNTQ